LVGCAYFLLLVVWGDSWYLSSHSIKALFKKYFIFDTETAGEVAVKNITAKRHMALKCFGM